MHSHDLRVASIASVDVRQFMVQNNLDEDSLVTKAGSLSFPTRRAPRRPTRAECSAQGLPAVTHDPSIRADTSEREALATSSHGTLTSEKRCCHKS